ncbi:MAG: radical SAM protein [Nitrospirae bacterium]|jgi:MoaA/NifB/PqqE/SkfB family radical SAM enzyme|nr:radical SAM protein [Nitrospirota bacterium]
MLIYLNKTTRYLYSRFKDLNILSKKEKIPENKNNILCLKPFYFAEITTNGDVYTCCPGWIRFPIGNIKNKTIKEIWNGSRAIYIRKKIYNGEWQNICNQICPIISQYIHDKKGISYDDLELLNYLSPKLVEEIRSKKIILESLPTVFNFSNSTQCNLSCIMCSRKNQKNDQDLILKAEKEVLSCISTIKRIVLTGMGEPFFRQDSKRLLFNNKNKEIVFDIITNGLLLNEYWDKIKNQRFGNLLISIDAAEKKVYEKIRKGGSWDTLQRSLNLVKDNKNHFESITLNMTVMRSNYTQIPDFIEMSKSYGFNVSFQRIRGSHANENFFITKDIDTINKLQKLINKEDKISKNIQIFWGDLFEYI